MIGENIRIDRMPHYRFPKHPQDHLDYSLTLPDGSSSPETLVVYVHGFASHQGGEKALYFRERFLGLGCAFLAFDHRGHGESSGTMPQMTVSRNLEDLEALLDLHRPRFQKKVLIGSSMGGQTAAWVAAREPARINANLLIAPAFRFFENRLRDLGPAGVEALRRDGEMTVKNEWVEVQIGKELLDDAAGYPMEALIPLYRTPTLILHGTEDDSVPFEDSVAFAEKSKARPLELFLIAGGDHRLTDHKETIFIEMKSFLKRTGILP